MSAAEWTVSAVVFSIAIGMAVISIRSFMNKGFLLNNAWLYASEKERASMDRKPYYRQTAVVFLILSLVFLVIGLSAVLRDGRINLLEIPLVAGAVIYAVISSVRIDKKEREKRQAVPGQQDK
ncbi:MAG: DUF3784 domain-containing protein [Clostridia bacterium]|nr:DUF3784 domain-containing protein [Clostridia bacterium]